MRLIDMIEAKPLPMPRAAVERRRVIVDGAMKKARPYVEPVKPEKKIKPKGPRVPTTNQIMAVLRESGKAWSMSEIAHELGLTVGTVSAALSKLVPGEVTRLDVKRNKRWLFLPNK